VFTVTHERETTDVDPIDALIPAPRSWWFRLVSGAVTVATVGAVSFLWGFGYIVPRPDCCGSGSSSALMSLSPDGEAVTVVATLFNSSGRDLRVESAAADLPGAEVLDVAMLDADNDTYPVTKVTPLPATAPGHELTRFVVTFVPVTCVDSAESAWGTVTLDLDVAGWWSIDRSHEIPVLESRQDLSVLPPAWATQVLDSPLAAACALLRR
jgi:hypothetical protein